MATHNENIPQQGDQQNPAERNAMPGRKDEQWEGDANLSKNIDKNHPENERRNLQADQERRQDYGNKDRDNK